MAALDVSFQVEIVGSEDEVAQVLGIFEKVDDLKNAAIAQAIATADQRMKGRDAQGQYIYVREPRIRAHQVINAWNTLHFLNADYPTTPIFRAGEGAYLKLMDAHSLVEELKILKALIPEAIRHDEDARIDWRDGRIQVTFSGRISKDGGYADFIFKGGGSRGFSFPVEVSYREWSDPDGTITHGDWCPRNIVDEHDADCPFTALSMRAEAAENDETGELEPPTEEEYEAAENNCYCGPDDCNCEPQVVTYTTAIATLWPAEVGAWVKEWFEQLIWTDASQPLPEPPTLPEHITMVERGIERYSLND